MSHPDLPRLPLRPLLEERVVLALQVGLFAWLWPWVWRLAPAPAWPLGAGDLLLTAVIVAPATALLVALLLRARGETLADVGLHATNRRPLFVLSVGVAAGLGLMLVHTVLGGLLAALGLEHDLSAFDISGATAWLGASLSGALLGGFTEELVYRGFLLTRLEALFASEARPRQGLLVAALATSVWFGAEHAYQGPLAVAVVTVSGLLLVTLTVLFRRRLLPVMVAHATVDALAFAALAFG